MIRKTLNWMAILLLLAILGGGAVVWYAWVQGDEYARQELRRRLSEIAPACDLQLGTVRFDWDRTIQVYDFAVRPRGQDVPPTFRAPEALLQIDREKFLEDQSVDVQLIRLIRPTLDLTRRLDGTWTVADLMPFRLDRTLAVPEWKIEDATIRFRIEQPRGKPVVLTLQHADLALVPAGRRQLTIRGLSKLADAGPLQVQGKLDLDRETWSLEGSINGLNTAGDIAGFVLGSSPELQGHVTSLRDKLQNVEDSILADGDSTPVSRGVPYRTVNRDGEDAPRPGESFAAAPHQPDAHRVPDDSETAPEDLTGLGINATLDLSFAFSKREHADAPDYRVQVKCRDGQIENPLLPFALRHLRGELFLDNTTLRLTSLRAEGDGSTLALDGSFRLGGPVVTGSASVDLKGLVISDQYAGELPPALERCLDTIRPSGPIDFAGTFNRTDDGGWSTEDVRLVAKGASATPEPFPVPIRDIVGTIRQVEAGRFDAELSGTIGGRPVRLVARTRDAEGGAEVRVQINAERVALDDSFRQACNEPTQEVLRHLDLEGEARVEVHLYRPPGPDQKYAWSFTAHVDEGELEYERFPYRLAQLTGDVTYNSQTRLLRFWNVAGRHGRSIVRGAGNYRAPPKVLENGTSPIDGSRPGLSLELIGEQVSLGDDLNAALPQSLQQILGELNLDGRADLNVDISWVPGTEPRIEVPKFNLTDGVLDSRVFPYRLHTIAATANYTPPGVDTNGVREPGRVTIRDFVGWHDGGVRVAAKNAELVLHENGDRQLDLPALEIEDLALDAEFRRAIPIGFRRAIEMLNPQGRIDVSGRLSLQGTRSPGDPISGDWNLDAKLVDAAANPGIEVSHATGNVACSGRFQGNQTELNGRIELEEAQVFGQTIQDVRGPFVLKNGQIQIGSQEALASGAGANRDLSVSIERQLSATYLEPGLLTLNAVIALEDVPAYNGRVTLTGGALEQLTKSPTGASRRNLAGVMNGSIDFQGQGTDPSGITGSGQLHINPAELYELPVVMQMFNALFPVPPDNTAFRSANLDFVIRNKEFVFERRGDWPIVLTGDSLKLIGDGRISFDGRVRLELITTLPNNPVKAVSSVPLIGPLVGQVVGGVVEAATTGWVTIVVEGTTDAPSARTVPLKAVPDGVRAMFDSLTPPRSGSRTAVLPGRRR